MQSVSRMQSFGVLKQQPLGLGGMRFLLFVSLNGIVLLYDREICLATVVHSSRRDRPWSMRLSVNSEEH
jgi:hypothetical protein